MEKSIVHSITVALCGLGIVILGAVTTAVTNYHAQGVIANIAIESITPILTAVCAGVAHYLTTAETKTGV